MLKSWGWGGVGGPCDYCVSPSPKNWVLGIFSLGQDLGTVGTGDSDLDLGLTIMEVFNVSVIQIYKQNHCSLVYSQIFVCRCLFAF